MVETNMDFYFSKVRLFCGNIFTIFLVVSSVLGVIIFPDESLFFTALLLFIIVLFSFFTVANILKMVRGYPYITITDEYIQLDPFTKSEITIYFKDIDHLKMPPKGPVEIILYQEDDFFAALSFHNKARLIMNRFTGYSPFTLNVKFVRKQERDALLKTLELIARRK